MTKSSKSKDAPEGKTLRREAETRLSPVVVLTSSSPEADVEGMYARQASCYVVKPVGAKELEKIVLSIHELWLTVVKLPSGA